LSDELLVGNLTYLSSDITKPNNQQLLSESEHKASGLIELVHLLEAVEIEYKNIKSYFFRNVQNRGYIAAIEPSQEGFHTLLGVKAGRFILLMAYIILIHATDF
jgi:hypothetical protein